MFDDFFGEAGVFRVLVSFHDDVSVADSRCENISVSVARNLNSLSDFLDQFMQI